MTDRELLELAAKAVHYDSETGVLRWMAKPYSDPDAALDYSIRPDGKAFYHSERNAMALADGGWFAPLTDDGDAMRLAVKLKFSISRTHCTCCIAVSDHDKVDWLEKIDGDECAVVRRAIVNAAAELGRQS